jgi:hypothetical protein
VDQRPGRVTLLGRQALEDERGVRRVQPVEPGLEFNRVLARNQRLDQVLLVRVLARDELRDSSWRSISAWISRSVVSSEVWCSVASCTAASLKGSDPLIKTR